MYVYIINLYFPVFSLIHAQEHAHAQIAKHRGTLYSVLVVTLW